MVRLILVLVAFVGFSGAEKKSSLQLIEHLGFHGEAHDVVTTDGYILKIFRIPNPGGTPVLIMPGFLSSSNTWLVAPRRQNIVATLADNGYDIWLLNYRGGFYGRKHQTLDPTKDAAEFWDFTFHEIGTIDIPSLIDYIQGMTRKRQVLYVGHSMGGLSFYVMCVERPDYCKKIKAAGLLAPVIFPPNRVDRTIISGSVRVVNMFAAAARRMGKHEVFGNEKDRAKAIERTCRIPIIGQSLCKLSMTVPFSGSASNICKRTLPKYLSNTLSGTSLKLAEHMTQLMSSSRYVPRFDYGRRKNLEKYGRKYAKYYNGTICAPVVVFHSTSDPFTDQEAIDRLKKVAPVVLDKLITDPTFNHNNFMFSQDLRKHIIDDLVKMFNRIRKLKIK